MNKMKELNQNDYNVKIVKDLGMEGETPKRQRFAIFECPTCKKHFKARTQQIKKGTQNNWDNNCISCGNKKRATIHGDNGTVLHKRWLKMIARTTQEEYKEHYENISVCEDWKDYTNFKEWAIANGFDEKLELDRIDVTGDYEPNNCRWTTRNIQAQNTNVLRKNNNTGYRGVSKFRDKFRARIRVNNKEISLGHYTTPEEAAYAYDSYVIDNNLEHNINNIGELPSFVKDNK